MLRSPRLWAGLVISVGFLALFFFRVEWGAFRDALRGANYAYVVPGVAFYFLALAFRTLRWRLILAPLGHIPARRLWRVMAVGYMANNLLPVRLGELVRAYYLRHREGVSMTSAVGTIAVERVFDGLSLIALALAVAWAVPLGGLVQGLGERARIPWPLLTLAFTLPFLGGLALLMAGARWPGGVERAVALLLAPLPPGVRRPALLLVRRFLEGLGALKRPRRVALVFLASFPVWLLESAMLYVIGVGFGLLSQLGGPAGAGGGMLLTTAVANLGGSVPAAGGGLGPFDFFSQSTLVLLGVEVSLASAFTVVAHFALLVPVTLLGLFYLWVEGLSLMALSRGARPPVPAGGAEDVALHRGEGI